MAVIDYRSALRGSDSRRTIHRLDLSFQLVGRRRLPPLEGAQVKGLWYVIQALFIGWFAHGMWQSKPGATAGELAVAIFIAVCLCAFLTACLTHLWDWTIRRLRGLRRNDSQTGGDSLGLIGTRRRLPKASKQVDGVRVRK